jgi:hypothetical protein
MSLTFQEKSLWVTLVALVLGLGGYFAALASRWPAAGAPHDVQPSQMLLLGSAVLLQVLILVIGHGVAAALDCRTDTDERGRQAALRGSRHGGVVLAVGVFLALCTALLTQGNFAMAHVLLAAWGLAQAVEIISQLVQLRQGD